MGKNETPTLVSVWVVAEGAYDLATVAVAKVKSRPPDFYVVLRSILANGLKVDLEGDIEGQPWFSAYEQGVEILVLVDGSGMFTISNLSSKTRFAYLKTLKQKVRPTHDLTRAFIVMSMSDGNGELDDIRDSIEWGVQEAARELCMPPVSVCRVDDRRGTTYRIDEEIFGNLEQCGLIVCDLTEEKPNCYFELAWAITHQRHIVVTAKKGTKIHFDASHFNIRFWENQRELRAQVKQDTLAVFSQQCRKGGKG